MAPVTPAASKKLAEKVKQGSAELQKTDAVICPPYIFLGEVGKATSKCALGAQNAFYEAEGAFTGEVSPHMLVNSGVKYVILGHSERRALGESNELIAKKISMALKVGLTVILCVGEKERDDEGKYLHILEEQIKNSLKGISKKQIDSIVIAYEPVWAIGAKATGVITPEALLETVIFIRKVLSDIYDKKIALSVSILYGGSVDEKNSSAFLKVQGVGGLLVGRASLDAEKFIKILKIAENI